MVALVGIARAVVSMTVSASDAATVADKVGITLLSAVLITPVCCGFLFMSTQEECVLAGWFFFSTHVLQNPVLIALPK